MAINQVQIRLSIDGQQALSKMDALELKLQDSIQANKALSDARTEANDKLKTGLMEIYKIQEKQAILEKQMAAASSSGQYVELTKLEGLYEQNAEKLTVLFEAQTKYSEVIHQNDKAITENTKAIKSQKKELEELYIVEGDVLKSEAALVKEKRALTRERALAGNGSDRQAKADARLLEIEKELANRILDRAKSTVLSIQKIIKEQGLEKVSTNDLILLNKALEVSSRNRADRTTEDAAKELAAIQDVNKELASRQTAQKPQEEGGIMGLVNKMKSGGGLMSAVVGGGIGAMAGGIFSAAIEGISRLGEVFTQTLETIKTKSLEITAIQTDLDVTRIKAKKINDSLNNIDTKTSVANLNNLVSVAGDLNVALPELDKFIVKADEIGTVLEKDFGSSEEAVTMIAKLKEEFKATREIKLDESLSKIGSLLKDLNLAGPATTKGIVEFLKRVGNIPDAIKPSITELAAYAAVFEEANLSSEVSATAFANVLSVGANNIEMFAKQMKISKEEVSKLINENPNEFILQFAKSLQGLKGDKFAQTLKSLHLEGSEAFKTIGILTDNIDKVREKQALANESFERGNTINRIFTTINNDEAASLEKTAKAWDKIKTSILSWLGLAISPAILAIAGMTKANEDLGAAYTRQNAKTKALISTVTPLQEKYKKLSEDAKNGVKNHSELNAVIAKIGEVVPDAITEWDSFGNALKINMGLVDEAIKKNKALQESTKLQYLNNYARKDNNLEGERQNLLRIQKESSSINNYLARADADKNLQYLKTVKYRKAEIDKNFPEIKKRLKEINDEIIANQAAQAKLNTVVDVPPATKKTGTRTEINEGAGIDSKETEKAKQAKEKAKRLKDAEDKYAQEQAESMIKLEAKLAFEERLASAKEEEKKIIQIEKKANDELEQVRKQFLTKEGLIIEFSKLSATQQAVINREELLIQQRLGEEKIKIQQDFIKKQDEIYEKHAINALKIAEDSEKAKLARALSIANRTGDKAGVFAANISISKNEQANELFDLKSKYIKEQSEAENNAKTLELIEENYQKNVDAIVLKHTEKRNDLIFDEAVRTKELSTKNALNALSINIQQAEQSGKDPFKLKLELLEAQKNAEIANAKQTGRDIAQIEAQFRLDKTALEKQHSEELRNNTVALFQQAFSSIASIFSSSLNNRLTAEQEGYDTNLNNLEKQKEKGSLSDKQYAKQKAALDKKHNEEQKKLKKEQFNIDKAANISQIIINTALGVMKASPNIPLQIATGVLGAVELGVASSQKFPEYAEGGMVETAAQNLPIPKPSPTAVLSWLNEKGQEYVVPNWQMNDPVIADLVGVIEYRRQNKIVGYEEGGLPTKAAYSFPINTATDAKKENAWMSEMVESILESNKQLRDSLQNIDVVVGYEASKKIVNLGNEMNAIEKSASAHQK